MASVANLIVDISNANYKRYNVFNEFNTPLFQNPVFTTVARSNFDLHSGR